MNLLQFRMQIDDEQIVKAIQEAEKHTSGEIRVYIATAKHPDPYTAAVKQFHKLGMTNTRDRNAVLIFIAPRSQTFAIVGDEAIHDRCGDAFWNEARDQMSRAFREQTPTHAIVQTVMRITKRLAEHFPRRDDDMNELPNAPVRGR